MQPRITGIGMLLALSIFAAAYVLTWQKVDAGITGAVLTAGYFTAGGLALLFAAKVRRSPLVIGIVAIQFTLCLALIYAANFFNQYAPWTVFAVVEPWTIAALFAVAETLLAVGGLWFLIKRIGVNPYLGILGVATLFTADHIARYGGTPGVFGFVWAAFAAMLYVAWRFEFVEGPVFAHLAYNLGVTIGR